jgi:hypothetical protein
MADEAKTETTKTTDTGELEQLRKQLRALSSEHEDLKEELKTTRAEARDRRHANKAFEEQVAALTKDRDDFKAKAEADPDGLRKQIADHAATIRSLKHERAFATAAHALKVTDPTKFADLIKLAGYQPEGDEPDMAKITASFQEALKGRAWLVDVAKDETAAGAAKTAAGAAGATAGQSGAKPGPGADRGQSVSSEQSQPTNRVAGRL